MKKNSISWQSYDYQYTEKSADWYWVLYIIFFSIIGISVYYFQDWIFAGMTAIILVVITLASRKKPLFRKYEIDSDNFYIDDRKKKIPFSEVESYFIDEWNYKILINTKDKYKPLVLIPFEENQNMSRIDSFLEKKIKKNTELRIPTIEVILSSLIGL